MLFLKTLPLLAGSVAALSAAGWRSQSIYQVITDRFAVTSGSTSQSCSLGNYCGGTFQGLINKLDYIQGMGFTAVWISPVVANLDTSTPYGLPYHGYWAQDIYSINPQFGTSADLVALSNALHTRGMYLMVDIVTNHMGYNGGPSTVQYDAFHPFNNQSYYHPYCAVDYSNLTSIEQCWTGDATVALPDLRTEDANVQAMWNSWVSSFVKNYTIDGLRIDSAQQVNTGFFPSFVTASGVYAIGEVFNGSPDFLCSYQNYMPGVLNYGYYFWIKRAFSLASATMSELAAGIVTMKATCTDTTLLGNFIENHDNPRFASLTTDQSLISNAIAFSILSDGIPIVYYGQEQGFAGAADPDNRQPLWPSLYNTSTPLYTLIAQLNTIRNFVAAQDATYAATTGKIIYTDLKTIVTQKGAPGKVLTSLFNNNGAGVNTSVALSGLATGFPAGVKYIDIVSCTTYTTDLIGGLTIKVSNGMPAALFNTAGLSGSGLCSVSSAAGATKSSSTSSLSRTSTNLLSTSATPSTTSASTVTSSCLIPVPFSVQATTAWGENIYLLGSTSQLSSWNTSAAMPLSAGAYPVWNTTINIPAGTAFTYKYLRYESDGTFTFENDPNRSFTVPTACAAIVSRALETYQALATSTTSSNSASSTTSSSSKSSSTSTTSSRSTSSSTSTTSSRSMSSSTSTTSSSGKTSSISTSTSVSRTTSSSNTIRSTSTTSPTSTTTSSPSPTPTLLTTAITCPKSNTTTVTSNGQTFLIQCGIDYLGGDLASVTALKFTDCLNLCAQNSSCIDVSWSGVICYMKSQLGKPVYNSVHGAKLVPSSSSGRLVVTTRSTSKASSSSTLSTSVKSTSATKAT